MGLEEIGDVLGDKLKTVQDWIKVLKQLFGYEKGQALRRISTPTEYNEELGLGKFGTDTNIMINFLDLVEREINKTVPPKRIFDEHGKQIGLIPYTDNSISRFGHGLAVASGSHMATRMKLGAQVLGQMQPENGGVDNEFPVPDMENTQE